MIASVAFRNFKALRETGLTLSPCNIVVGPNGSGKTSLIQSLLRLRTLAKLPLAGPVDESAKRKEGPEIVFQFDGAHATLTARLSCVSDLVCDLLQIEPRDNPAWPALKADIGKIRSYLFDHYAMSEPSDVLQGEVLVSNGGNLAAVIHHLRTASPDIYQTFVTECLRIMPEYIAVDTRPAGGKVELVFALGGDEGWVTSDNLSQGTLYMLGILVLAYSPARPSVLCIEEIDRGIHPRMMREIRDALYRLSYPASFGSSELPVQVIATTHSPYLLDLFRDHPEEIVITQKHGREAQFTRLVDRPDLDELLQEGSLGDLWFSGILGGVPDVS